MAGEHGELGTLPFRDEIKGNVLNHPPVPGDSTGFTSTRQPEVKNTGDQPGPYEPLGDPPFDPRLHYPRTIAQARPRGQGCSACRWNGACKLLFWQLNFGNVWLDEGTEGSVKLNPSQGTACESWNGNFPDVLPGENYNNDGWGLGDPWDAGTMPPEALDPTRYDGQWGDLRAPGAVTPSSVRT